MIKARLQQWLPLQRLVPYRLAPYRLRYILVPALLWFVVGVVLLGSRHPRLAGLVPLTRQRLFASHAHRMSSATALPKLASRISCRGPRRRVLSDSPDDELQYGDVSVSYPTPFLGSQRELGIRKTWMTADGRYGPYGFGQEKDTYSRSRVDWEKVDWGKLQDDCFNRNAERFPTAAQSIRVNGQTRFTWLNQTAIKPTPAWDAFNGTRRTALVIRSYSNFAYKPEDMWHARSLITETALHSGGEYAVFLLVHVQDRESNILASQANYDAAFEAANIPPELQSIAVLWDDHMLESWYAAVGEHRTMWQVNQPLQLFALHYPEFDHYWQIELDQRFMGHAGEYLDAVSAFARNEPRKQALERATFAFNEGIHGTYRALTAQVDAANNGASRAWGPVRIPDIQPIGPEPPVARPEDDDFLWGVGEDADVVVTSMCADVMHATQWMFRDYITGFYRGRDTPRWFCPPAVMRASRALLLAVHQGQHAQGLSIPSEAVLPTWALWHGLKLSYPPQPAYMRPHEPELEDFEDETTRDEADFRNKTRTPWFGSTPAQSTDGLSHGTPQSFADRGMTWWWTASWPRRIVDIWLAGDTEAERMPALLAVVDGRVYVPNLAMHPVKT
ncbi:Uncharacterized protein TPAR_00246 [Tolypocladium paradoxum]|uniref:Biotin synthase-like protein n=1 Tax=Tolypocladium paradoxum TaxID=94208 RepID=A0A2S4LAT0_9HYPO|nr:Uncharacterized protein TPAR_00246 [Tolypocladium paradoxum]